ncbi:MAG: hypothetical protein H0V17_01445, partial [Deltaproteobacteria bacterium]|nr:hypothetical protein [Deltaproteobacteria bacterium]
MIRCSFLLAVLVSSVIDAHAEDIGTLPNGAVLEWPRLFIRDGEDLVEPPDSETLRSRLNLASCVCSQVSDAADTNLYYELHLSTTTNMNLPAEVMTGTSCDDDIQQATNCTKIPDEAIGDIDVLATREDTISVKLYDLINARADQRDQPCVEANGGSAFVWVVVDTDQNSDPDFFSPRPIDLGVFTDVIGFDTKAPPLPDNISATGGEGSIEITWDIPDANATDLYAFQAFCMDANGEAVSAGEPPLYSTTATVCGIAMPLDLVASPIDNGEGTEVTVAPTPFQNLDPAFLCGTQESGTATSLRIEGLENNMEYTVALVAVDFYGNPIGTFLSRTIVP